VSLPTWRLIVSGAVPGAMNMATDRAVLAARARGDTMPTLRLYTWEVPTVSLGRFQPVEQVDLSACARRGFDVVRRPTGGRGVLHDDEVTYSIVANTGDGVPRGVAASYRYLSSALAVAYRVLGVDAELTDRRRGPASAGACYLHATQADLSLGAAKLSGSAQVWKDDAVLQHGSFVVERDVEAEGEVFSLDGVGLERLSQTTATLATALGTAPTRDEIIDAIARAVEDTFGVLLVPGALTSEESDAAAAFAADHIVWTASREA